MFTLRPIILLVPQNLYQLNYLNFVFIISAKVQFRVLILIIIDENWELYHQLIFYMWKNVCFDLLSQLNSFYMFCWVNGSATLNSMCNSMTMHVRDCRACVVNSELMVLVKRYLRVHHWSVSIVNHSLHIIKTHSFRVADCLFKHH